MSIIERSINVSELDFNTIKSNLISYFKRENSPFKDWNFEGSGLNTLLDVLSYNTHFNAMLAHMSVNETFLDTAQLRSSVVSNAKLLGYIPNSYTAAKAILNISFTPKVGVVSKKFLILPKGSQFSSSLNGVTYIFSTTESYQIIYDETINRYTGIISVYEGVFRSQRFQVNASLQYPAYIIDSSNIDTSKLSVKVYASGDSSNYTVYTKFESFDLVSAENPLYFIQENSLGKYEVSFGDNRFGKKPNNLSIIEVEYFTTNGPASNGCMNFNYVGGVDSPDISANVSAAPLVMTYIDDSGRKYIADGGATKESLDSIRFNAPLAYVAQNRAVTINDYASIIKNEFPRTESISVWGGENHIPVSYGKVFISIKPKDGLYLSEEDKEYLYSVLRPRSVLTIKPVIVDPYYVKVALDVLVKYNRNITNLSKTELEEKLKSYIIAYNDSTLESFEKVFTYSTLLTNVISQDPSVVNGHLRVYLTQTFSNNPSKKETHSIDFGAPLDVDDGKTITFASGYYDSEIEQSILIGDTEDPSNSKRRVLYTYYKNLENAEVKRNTNIGYIDLTTGVASIETLPTSGITDITLEVIPLSNDVVPDRNQIIIIDTNRLNVIADVDVIATGGMSNSSYYTPFKRER
jgi:hypothetical protein